MAGMTRDNDHAAWVGRQETREDEVTAGLVDRLHATLDHDEVLAGPGSEAPPLTHWALFLPKERQSGLGPDGHAARGGFLPPVHDLPRRMWAGGRFRFLSPLRVGVKLQRVSTVANVTERKGASGRLVFVTVKHEIAEAESGKLLLTEEHDIVYRGAGGVAAKAPRDFPGRGTWHHDLVPDATLLFRYSALTFNGHRIHYDRAYVTEVEGYPGLIVHGPLIATLLLDLVRLNAPSKRLSAFSFRAVSPVFDGQRLNIDGEPPDAEGHVRLWASNAAGGLAMSAEAQVA